MIIKAKTIKGLIKEVDIKTIIFYNVYNDNVEKFEYEKWFSIEINNKLEFDSFLLKLNINKDILLSYLLNYDKLLRELISTNSLYFEIKIDLNNNYKLIY